MSKKSIKKILISSTLLPVLVSTFLIAIISSIVIKNKMEKNVFDTLETAANSLSSNIQYELQLEGEKYGNLESFLSDYGNAITDDMKDISGCETTIFYKDRRIGTSIVDEVSGKRLIGTTCDNAVKKQVVDTLGICTYKSNDTIINNKKYYTYYQGLYIDNEFVGMVFAGKEADDVTSTIKQVTLAVIIPATILIIVSVIVAFIIANKISHNILLANRCIKTLSEGYLTDEDMENALSSIAMEDKTEIGEMSMALVHLKDKLKEIVSILNLSILHLNEEVDNVSETNIKAASTTETVAQAIVNVAEGATSQAQNVQVANENTISIGDNIDNIGTDIDELSNIVANVKEIGKTATKDMDSVLVSNDKMNVAIANIKNKIDDTNKAVSFISEATEFIMEIADQTNLLSLNAAIEAARVGESGKGFAVVAREIKELADKSNNSAKEIDKNINSLIEKFDETVEQTKLLVEQSTIQANLVNKTCESFKELELIVDKTSEKTNDIADLKNNINEAKNSLSEKILDLSAISEENAASAEETSASTEMLNQGFTNMKSYISNLKLAADEVADKMTFFK